MPVEELSDEDLIRTMREGRKDVAEACLETLFERYYAKVVFWCLRISGDRQSAADLAQEVFLRVHQHLDSFRLESRFSTWLYTVTRSVAINRSRAARRRRAQSLDDEAVAEPPDPSRRADERVEVGQIARELRRAMERDLRPLEARVLYLHFVEGMTVRAITELLELRNRSGAKAYLVAGKRKLDRRFGRWLRSQSRSPVERKEAGA